MLLFTNSVCLECEPGRYCPGIASEASLPCPPGTYSEAGATTCTTCPAGSYCPHPELKPIPCLDGEYSYPGQSACTRCPPGKQCSLKNTAGTNCNEGTYSIGGQKACTSCPAGYFCKDTTKAPTELCGEGTYSLDGQVGCTVSLVIDCRLVLKVRSVLLLLKLLPLQIVTLDIINSLKGPISANNVSLDFPATVKLEHFVILGLTLLEPLILAPLVL